MNHKDFHPLFMQDIDSVEAHILSVADDAHAALRRVCEFEALIESIMSNPESGTRLSGRLTGCLVRHGGRDMKIRIVFKSCVSKGFVLFLLASFGGQNWSELAGRRL